MAEDWAKARVWYFFCGRFEGLDQRVIEVAIWQEVSLGDFILAGGEVAAMAMLGSDASTDPRRRRKSGLG